MSVSQFSSDRGDAGDHHHVSADRTRSLCQFVVVFPLDRACKQIKTEGAVPRLAKFNQHCLTVPAFNALANDILNYFE